MIRFTFFRLLAITSVLALGIARSSEAGEQRFKSGWTSEAHSDLARMLHLHQWSDEVIEKSLNRFVYYLALGRGNGGQEMVVDGLKGAAIVVVVDDRPIKGARGCLVGSLTLKNALRTRTSAGGVFCSRDGGSWTYDPEFLEITEIDVNNNTLKTTDVTDIGKKRPK
ncbi:MAG: hypothetical protein K2Q10_13530 [Rhodospirillales bacterium]|nr:hypothetical protein [Rhodospirillales bacterium]